MKTTTIKISFEARKALKVLAAENDKTMIEMLDEILNVKAKKGGEDE